MSIKRLQARGDTILEVLIALTVISFILTASYSLANHSLAASRDAQEHVEALKLAEGQLEELQNLSVSSKASHTALFSSLASSPVFCIDAATGTKIDFTLGSPNPSTDLDTFQSPPYPAQCNQSATSLYNIFVEYNQAANDLFIVHVRWDRINGGKDEVSLDYTLH